MIQAFEVYIKIFKRSNLEEKEYTVGDFTFKCIHTPGHSKDSVTFFFEEDNLMFIGDFIFKESIGRTDLPGGNDIEMKESIKSIIEWHEQTFPKANLKGQIVKIEEEWDEFQNAGTYKELVEECADLFIVACGIARFSALDALFYFHQIEHLIGANNIYRVSFEKAIDKKMAKNRKRKWSTTAEGTYHHTNKEN